MYIIVRSGGWLVCGVADEAEVARAVSLLGRPLICLCMEFDVLHLCFRWLILALYILHRLFGLFLVAPIVTALENGRVFYLLFSFGSVWTHTCLACLV